MDPDPDVESSTRKSISSATGTQLGSVHVKLNFNFKSETWTRVNAASYARKKLRLRGQEFDSTSLKSAPRGCGQSRRIKVESKVPVPVTRPALGSCFSFVLAQRLARLAQFLQESVRVQRTGAPVFHTSLHSTQHNNYIRMLRSVVHLNAIHSEGQSALQTDTLLTLHHLCIP